MLLRTLYKSLPYLLIVSGVYGGIVIGSDIVLICSAVLMLAGFILLWLRHYPPERVNAGVRPERQSLKTRNWADIFQAEQERRMTGVIRTFPLIDNNGNLIQFDRRATARSRTSDAA